MASIRRWRSAVKRGDCESWLKRRPGAADGLRDASHCSAKKILLCSKMLDIA
jgi:hypothetical protein